MAVKRKYSLISLIIGILIGILISNINILFKPLNYFVFFTKYKTQKIMYVNKNNPDLTIEFQLKNAGGLSKDLSGLGADIYKARTIMRDKSSF